MKKGHSEASFRTAFSTSWIGFAPQLYSGYSILPGQAFKKTDMRSVSGGLQHGRKRKRFVW